MIRGAPEFKNLEEKIFAGSGFQIAGFRGEAFGRAESLVFQSHQRWQLREETEKSGPDENRNEKSEAEPRREHGRGEV
jgi:hypothetical protein